MLYALMNILTCSPWVGGRAPSRTHLKAGCPANHFSCVRETPIDVIVEHIRSLGHPKHLVQHSYPQRDQLGDFQPLASNVV